MAAVLSFSFLLVIGAFVYLQHPKFGKAPAGQRLERIRQSPHYRNGKFENITETPTFAAGHKFWGELRKSMLDHHPGRYPLADIPSIKTDLLNLPANKNVLVWFGHSSCFIQLEGKRILIDPVFSPQASPVPGSVKAFEGTNVYTAADLPAIDYLLISHDHYDHLDYETILAVKHKTKKVICGLGVGAHFEHWGYRQEQILEKDWHEEEKVDSNFVIYTVPARHKSGRGFRQNNTLWLSFVIKSLEQTIYISGDGGYDSHFAAIGNKFGPIDLAIMENGQYDPAWHYIHLLPEEVLNAAHDLKAKRLLPVHHSKFVLARHPWYEPLVRITAMETTSRLITPMIGEVVRLDDPSQEFQAWWESVGEE